MCMEDIRIGRATLCNEVIYTTPITTFQQVLGPDEDRIAITFCIADNTVVMLLTTDPTPTGQRGIKLTVGAPYIKITLDDFGDLVRRPWYAKADAAQQTSLFTVSLKRE